MNQLQIYYCELQHELPSNLPLIFGQFVAIICKRTTTIFLSIKQLYILLIHVQSNLSQITQQHQQVGGYAVVTYVHIVEMTAVGNALTFVDAANGYHTGFYLWQNLFFDGLAVAHPCFSAHKHRKHFAEKAYFSDSEWNAMLHADLDNNRPVFYSGRGSGGHAFVCDGYNADGYYHFNFGWGGFADGWFLTNAISPGSSNFNDSQAALFGISPTALAMLSSAKRKAPALSPWMSRWSSTT